MNLDQVKASFAPAKRGTGAERHSIKSLSKRLLLSRQTVRKMLKAGELEFQQRFDEGANGTTHEFSSARLDATREAIVEEIIQEICSRLQGLDVSEQEKTLAALHGLRAQKADVETEFSKPSDDDENDDDSDHEVAKLIGGTVGVLGGATLGIRAGGALGMVGGAAVGGTAGSIAAGNAGVRDAAVAGGIGYAAHKAIQAAGGYRAVANTVGVGGGTLKGRMIDAIRAAAAKLAKAEV